MVHCNSCGKQNAPSFNFCLDCGHELRKAAPTASAPKVAPHPLPSSPIPLTNVVAPSERRCPSCSLAVPAGFSFCGACGTRIGGVARSATVYSHGAALARIRCRLVSIQPDGTEGASYLLDGTESVAGTGDVPLRFADDPFVSPRHCRFYVEGEKLHVEDLGSLNGVFKKVRGEQSLVPGDHLRLGRQLLRLEPMVGAMRLPPEGTRIWGSPDPGYQARLLQVLQGGGVGEVFPLRAGDNLVGRDQGDVTFPTDRFVSGRHAVLAVQGDEVRVRDLGSSNGTFVRIRSSASLDAGDFLLVGNELLRVDLR